MPISSTSKSDELGRARQARDARELEAQAKRLRRKTAQGARRINLRSLIRSNRKQYGSGRASKRQGSFVKRGVVQTLNFKEFRGSRAGDRYSERKSVASFSNMLGKNSKERLEEFDIDLARHPGVAPENLIKHIALSLPPGQKRTVGQWQVAIALFMKKIGSGGNWVAHLHEDTDSQHVHVVYSRSRPDGRLVNLSWSYLKHREAAAQVADELFGGRETQRNVNTPPAPPSDRAEAARRRAQRRRTISAHIDPAIVRAALETASSPAELAQALQARRVEMSVSRREDGTARGLLLRRAGAQEWLAASSIGRDLSLARVQSRLAENAASAPGDALRHQAQEQARSLALRQTPSPSYSRQRGG